MKTVVITGSTRGIGLGMAKEFLKRHCRVTISSRSRSNLAEELKNLRGAFGEERVHGLACDVTQSDQIQALWNGTKEKFGTVDIWINNAGITNSMKSLLELDITEVFPVVSTNITGLIYGSLIAFKGMTDQGFGQIYNLYGHGSNDSKVSGLHVYGTTKRAVRYFNEALIQDAEDTPVKVCSISPGIVVTDFLISDMRTMPQNQLETVKALYNCLADTVETVTPFLVESILSNDKNGTEINWLTEEKVNERMNSDDYCSRDLFSKYGL
jgi:short-subunit dehydrogenase